MIIPDLLRYRPELLPLTLPFPADFGAGDRVFVVDGFADAALHVTIKDEDGVVVFKVSVDPQDGKLDFVTAMIVSRILYLLCATLAYATHSKRKCAVDCSTQRV